MKRFVYVLIYLVAAICAYELGMTLGLLWHISGGDWTVFWCSVFDGQWLPEMDFCF